MSELIHDSTKNETIVLYNKRADNYALWVGSETRVYNNQVYFWPYVVETGYSIELISTKEELLKYYDVIGVL